MGLTTTESAGLKFIRLKSPEDEDPVFVLIEKNEATGKWEVAATHNTFIGRLESIETKETEYNDKKGMNVVTRWSDKEGDRYQIEVNFNTMICRSLLNNLASIDQFGQINMVVKKNKKGYPSIYIKNDGDDVSWKYSMDEMPKPKEIKDPDTGEFVKWSRAEQNKFFLKVLEDISAKVSDQQITSAPPAQTSEQKQQDTASKQAVLDAPDHEGEDDLPF